MEPKEQVKKKRGGQRQADKNCWIKGGVGKQIASIDTSALVADPVAVSSNSGHEEVCSYNWAKTADRCIYVPGAPPKWMTPDVPVTVPKDSGVFFLDLNASKMPTCPLIPLFSSLRTMNPSFSFADVDLLTNRNSLRKLLEFAQNRVSQSFRIDVNLIQKTLVLFRCERNVREFLPPKAGGHASYGHNFEAAFTTPAPGLEASMSHHRTVQYDLGGLKCVVQFEVDAWFEEGKSDDFPDTAAREKGDDALSNIEQGLAGLSLHSSGFVRPSDTPKSPSCRQKARPPEAKRQRPFDLSVLKGDDYLQPPSQRLAEIKVRSGKSFQSSKAIPQMWFGRTPYLISGLHDEGVFRGIKVEHMGEKFASWEDRSQASLRKLVTALTQLADILMTQRQEMSRSNSGRSHAAMTWALTCDHKVKPAQLVVHEVAENAKTAVIPHEHVKAFWPEH